MAGAAAVRELTRGAREVALAASSDDAELRALLRRTVVPGAIRLAFTREPRFFDADGLAGSTDTTVIARHGGRLIGLGRMSVMPLMKNGRSRRMGYLSALRVDPGATESPRLIRDGYDLLHREAGSADGFFTSIASDNVRARRVLEHGGRFGIPSYRPVAHLVTLVAPARHGRRRERGHGTISPVTQRGSDVTAFLSEGSRAFQLSLPWARVQWDVLARHGVCDRDVLVVRHEGNITGAAAIWDQRAFRQTVIHGYSGPLGVLRPLLNELGAIRGAPRLPAPGSILRHGAVLGGFVRKPDDWMTLWPELVNRSASMGLEWLTICRDARDPELGILRRLARAREYLTTLYEVHWRGDPPCEQWDARLFRPEAGLL